MNSELVNNKKNLIFQFVMVLELLRDKEIECTSKEIEKEIFEILFLDFFSNIQK